MLSDKRGFTLIELLIVGMLIGVFAVVSLNIINRDQQEDQANNAVVQSNLLKLGEGLQAFVQAEGYVPQDTNSDSSIMDEANVSVYLQNWPDNTPEGAVYNYNFIAGPPDAFSVDATRFSEGCYSYCSIDGEIFEDSSSCSAIVNSCNNPIALVTVCGDGNCEGDETCSTCVSDCGECHYSESCGDSLCNNGETCSACPGDCGVCPPPPPPPPACGDGSCNGTETCSSCVADCGICPPPPPVCGDGSCNGLESCVDCPGDCGACAPLPPVCGDGSCNGTETCSSCATDCGACVDWDPQLSCPTGMRQIGFFEDWVQSKPDGVNIKYHAVNITHNSRVTVVGFAGEGRPEDCPDGELCHACPDGGMCGEPPQDDESFTMRLGTSDYMGTYYDSGEDPGVGWYPLVGQPWTTSNSYSASTRNIIVEHLHVGTLPSSSVSYRIWVCEDE